MKFINVNGRRTVRRCECCVEGCEGEGNVSFPIMNENNRLRSLCEYHAKSIGEARPNTGNTVGKMSKGKHILHTYSFPIVEAFDNVGAELLLYGFGLQHTANNEISRVVSPKYWKLNSPVAYGKTLERMEKEGALKFGRTPWKLVLEDFDTGKTKTYFQTFEAFTADDFSVWVWDAEIDFIDYCKEK